MEQLSLILAGCAFGGFVTLLFVAQHVIKLAIFTKNKVESDIETARLTLKQASELNQTLIGKIEVLEDQHRAMEFYKVNRPK